MRGDWFNYALIVAIYIGLTIAFAAFALVEASNCV
jgi:hypothetical protein